MEWNKVENILSSKIAYTFLDAIKDFFKSTYHGKLYYVKKFITKGKKKHTPHTDLYLCSSKTTDGENSLGSSLSTLLFQFWQYVTIPEFYAGVNKKNIHTPQSQNLVHSS